jgi:hypothetical protein
LLGARGWGRVHFASRVVLDPGSRLPPHCRREPVVEKPSSYPPRAGWTSCPRMAVAGRFAGPFKGWPGSSAASPRNSGALGAHFVRPQPPDASGGMAAPVLCFVRRKGSHNKTTEVAVLHGRVSSGPGEQGFRVPTGAQNSGPFVRGHGRSLAAARARREAVISADGLSGISSRVVQLVKQQVRGCTP